MAWVPFGPARREDRARSVEEVLYRQFIEALDVRDIGQVGQTRIGGGHAEHPLDRAAVLAKAVFDKVARLASD